MTSLTNLFASGSGLWSNDPTPEFLVSGIDPDPMTTVALYSDKDCLTIASTPVTPSPGELNTVIESHVINETNFTIRRWIYYLCRKPNRCGSETSQIAQI